LNPDGKIATPNIDRLAAGGMIFTDAHSSSSVCSPTRYGILTGRYNWRSRLKSGVLGGMSPRLIEPGRLTVPAALKQRRQYTACKPFFLYLALSAPHTPIAPTPEWRGRSGLNPYGDFVMEVDWTVGQVLAALDRNSLAANTLVIVTSDNGCSPEAKFDELTAKGHNPSYHFRGYKADIFDGGHRIPFIVRWPGHVKARATSQQLIC